MWLWSLWWWSASLSSGPWVDREGAAGRTRLSSGGEEGGGGEEPGFFFGVGG